MKMNLEANQGLTVKIVALKSLMTASGLMGFAAIALSSEVPSTGLPVKPGMASVEAEVTDEISNGTVINLDDDVSLSPIAGWKIDRKASGMSLVMKEVLPAPVGAIDYSKPIFARNITVMTLPSARPMDSASVEEVKADISKMISRQGALTDFRFTDVKSFDYKGKNDGLVLYSQLTVNKFSMMQMQIVISGEKNAYLLTYSDLAANFANPATYDAAWKSMTSITVDGVAPVRYEKEVTTGITVFAGMVVLFAPLLFLRWLSARRIRILAEELQYDWDHGAKKSDADYELSDIHSLDKTRSVRKMGSKKKAVFGDIDASALSSISSMGSRI
jgi:hypothetical protein